MLKKITVATRHFTVAYRRCDHLQERNGILRRGRIRYRKTLHTATR